MAVIARWTISVCPDCGQRISGGYPECEVDGKPHYAPDKVDQAEVVRADLHRGAVEALREARGELEYAIANGSDLAHDDVRRVESILRAALGGQ